MNYQHQGLAAGRWEKLSLVEQLANVGSEVGRALAWREKGNGKYSQLAVERGLELLDLTLADRKNRTRLKEVARVRELLVDYFLGENQFASSAEFWRRYFYPLTYAAQLYRGKI